jgi:Holliday junction resolvase RusA-like endonuclease
MYPAPGYQTWLSETLPALEALKPRIPADIRDRDVAIDIEVLVKRPKTTKRSRPRGDNDNYEKGVWDAMTKVGGWWFDDDQVVENRTRKRFTTEGEEPGYRVRVEFLEN